MTSAFILMHIAAIHSANVTFTYEGNKVTATIDGYKHDVYGTTLTVSDDVSEYRTYDMNAIENFVVNE
jgi:hypothetical protein